LFTSVTANDPSPDTRDAPCHLGSLYYHHRTGAVWLWHARKQSGIAWRPSGQPWM